MAGTPARPSAGQTRTYGHLRDELDALLARDDVPHVERLALAAAIVPEALRARGLEATLVGSGAIEFYAPDSHATSDINVVRRALLRPRGEMTASLVQLRNVHADDLDAFFEHQTDTEAVAMAAFPARDREAFLNHWSRVLEDPRNSTWTILAAGDVAGYVACFPQHDALHVGYFLGRPFWGRGIATAALAQLLGEVPARPLFARVAEHNVGSRRVLEKCGFEQIGRVPPGPDDDVAELLFRME